MKSMSERGTLKYKEFGVKDKKLEEKDFRKTTPTPTPPHPLYPPNPLNPHSFMHQLREVMQESVGGPSPIKVFNFTINNGVRSYPATEAFLRLARIAGNSASTPDQITSSVLPSRPRPQVQGGSSLLV